MKTSSWMDVFNVNIALFNIETNQLSYIESSRVLYIHHTITSKIQILGLTSLTRFLLRGPLEPRYWSTTPGVQPANGTIGANLRKPVGLVSCSIQLLRVLPTLLPCSQAYPFRPPPQNPLDMSQSTQSQAIP